MATQIRWTDAECNSVAYFAAAIYVDSKCGRAAAIFEAQQTAIAPWRHKSIASIYSILSGKSSIIKDHFNNRFGVSSKTGMTVDPITGFYWNDAEFKAVAQRIYEIQTSKPSTKWPTKIGLFSAFIQAQQSVSLRFYYSSTTENSLLMNMLRTYVDKVYVSIGRFNDETNPVNITKPDDVLGKLKDRSTSTPKDDVVYDLKNKITRLHADLFAMTTSLKAVKKEFDSEIIRVTAPMEIRLRQIESFLRIRR